jgi:asparagine synthase (glutamine-hydrolysing)
MRNDPIVRNYTFETLLSDRALGRGYFDPLYVKESVESHMDGGRDNASLMGILLASEIFFRQFVDGDGSPTL